MYMGNGQHLVCCKKCVEVELMMQGNQFEVDLHVLHVWRLDIVLDMQWLRTFGPCIHDHKKLTMEFQWKGKQVKWARNTKLATRQVSFTQFSALILEGDVRGVYKLTTSPFEEVEHIVPGVGEFAHMEANFPTVGSGILHQFQQVFEKSKQLPPIRNIDYMIHLQPGSTSINVRLYRYPFFQKDVMEKLVKEMLDCGFIHHSNNPYSFLMLLE